MSHITVEEVYRGDKYNFIGKVIKDYLSCGRPIEYDKRTWIEMLIVKYAIIAAEEMIKEGDLVSTMFDTESLSLYVKEVDYSQ